MSDILARAVCGIHDSTMGVLRNLPNGARRYSTNNVGLFARNRRLLGPGDNSGWIFYEARDYERDIEAWCSDCGGEARSVPGDEATRSCRGTPLQPDSGLSLPPEPATVR